MFRYLNILLNASYKFLPPNKNKILVFDYESESIVKKILKKEKVSFVSTRKEEINLFILFRALIEFKFKYFDYLITYIKHINPKLLVTSIDNDRDFYRVKKHIPELITIFFQNGHRTGYNGDSFEILEQKKKLHIYKKEFKVDLMCVFNKMTSDLYKKFINGNTFIAGSIKSNNCKIFKEKNCLVFVSIFKMISTLFIPEAVASHNKLLKILKKFCQEKKLKLVILGKYITPSRQLVERKYFMNILGNDYHFVENSLKRNTYKIIDNSKIVVSPGSTMGLESLGRKKKTAIIHVLPNKYPTKKNFWGYYTKRKNHGFFWNNGVDEKKVLKILNRLIKISQSQWRNKIKNYEYETTVYDYKNYNLKKNLKNFLNKEKININPYLV